MDRGAWQATAHGVAKELDMTQQLNSTRRLSLDFSSISAAVLPLSWDPHRDIVLQSRLSLHWSMAASQTSLAFHHLDSFEASWKNTLQNVLQFGLSDVFLMIRLGLWV